MKEYDSKEEIIEDYHEMDSAEMKAEIFLDLLVDIRDILLDIKEKGV